MDVDLSEDDEMMRAIAISLGDNVLVPTDQVIVRVSCVHPRATSYLHSSTRLPRARTVLHAPTTLVLHALALV